MRPVLLDTNAYSGFKRGDKNIIEVVKHAEILAISPIVLGELLGGFDCGTKSKINRDELHSFLGSARIRLFPINADTAAFYSQIYFCLKNKGNPIPTNDLWIAAQALEHGFVVCTFDNHFKAIDGLVSGTTVSELLI